MSFAILKLSYNRSGESLLTGGICGTGFFIDNSTAISAHHVLNENTFAPNSGYRFCRVWILSRNGFVTSLNRDSLKSYPELDIAMLKFQKPLSGYDVYTLAANSPETGTGVYGIGYIGNIMPQVEAHWRGDHFIITNCNLGPVSCDKEGYIKNLLRLNVNAQDVKLQNIWGFEVSFDSLIGMSGGPLINKGTSEVIGLLSFGLPVDSSIKTQTFAVTVAEIKKHVLKSST